MKIAMVQFQPEWLATDQNLQKCREYIRKAADNGAQLVVFPELCLTGFSMNTGDYGKMSMDYDSLFSKMAAEYQLFILAGYPARTETMALRNRASLFSPSGRIQSYDKQNLFPLTEEERVFKPGKANTAFTLDSVSIGVAICFDLRFPELFRKIAAEVDLFIVLANWPESRRQHWLTLLQARAIENQCFVIGVNRTGTDNNGIIYSGDSSVFNPNGEILQSMDDQTEMDYVTLNPSLTRKVRTQFPFLKQMKQDN